MLRGIDDKYDSRIVEASENIDQEVKCDGESKEEGRNYGKQGKSRRERNGTDVCERGRDCESLNEIRKRRIEVRKVWEEAVKVTVDLKREK